MTAQWFAYDGDIDFTFCDSPEEAEQAAAEYLDKARDRAGDDGWPDWTASICWGQVLGCAVVTREVDRGSPDLTDHDRNVLARFDVHQEYELRSIPPVVDPDTQALLVNLRIWLTKAHQGHVGFGPVVIVPGADAAELATLLQRLDAAIARSTP
jgi:hypothetical protein